MSQNAARTNSADTPKAGMIAGPHTTSQTAQSAYHSFIDEKLQLRPPLSFIGAYSSLEMANGDTIVSTGIALVVLVGIGTVQF